MSIKDTVISLAIKAKNLLSGDVDDASESLENLQKKSKALRTNLKKLEDQKKLITQFEKQQKTVDKTQESYLQLANRVATLRTKIQETGDPTNAFSVQLEKTQAAAFKASRSLGSQTVELNKLKNSLKSSNVDASNLAKSEEKLNREIKNSKTVLQSYSKNMRDMGKATAETDKQASKFSLAKAAYWTAGVLAISRFTSELKTMALSVFTTGDKFEGLRIQMDALMGSIEGGATATAWIKEFTKKTPLQLEQVTETFARLKAFGLDPMDGSMQAIIDQSEKLGGGMERVEGISLALGQAWAKQKLQGEEILQMIERGVPVWELLEKSTGRNTAELQKLSSEGKLGRDVIKDLMSEIAKGADGAAAANMGRMSGLVSNLKDEWQLFSNYIAQSGALEYAKQQLKELGDTIKQLGQDGTLKKWAQNISDAFIDFVNGAKDVTHKIYEMKEGITLLAATALKLKLASMFVGFAQSATAAIASMSTFSGATATATIRAKAFAGVLKGAFYYAVAEAGVQIYKLGDAYLSLKKSQSAAAESLDLQKTTTEQLTARYKKYSEQVGIAITSTDQWEALIKSGQVTFNETTKVFERTNSALEKQTELQKHNAEVMAKLLLPATEQLNNQFTDLVVNGSSVTDAIADIAKSLDVDNSQGLNNVVEVLAELKSKSQITADEIETGLRKQLKNLSSKELAAIRQQSGDTFKALGVDIKSIINEVDPLRKQFELLGLDLNLIRDGFTETGKEALTAFSIISKSATSSANDIDKAFDAVFANTNTTSELDALRNQIVGLGKDGVLTGKKIETMLKTVDEKLFDLTPGLHDLDDAFKVLGATSQAELNKIATSSKAAFDAINASNASLRDKKTAFIAYAETAIEANAGVISSEIKIQAAVLGVTDLIVSQGAAVNENADKWINRAETIAKNSESIVEAALRERHALEDTNDAVSSLNNSSLSNLRSEIGSTTLMVNGLKDASELAIEALEKELLQAQGKQSEIDEMEQKEKVAAIQDQIDLLIKLSRSGVSVSDNQIESLKTQKRLLQEIYKTNQETAVAELKTTSNSSIAEQSVATTETVSVVLTLGNETAVIPTTSQGKDDLLSLLEKNSLVTS